MFVKPWGHGPGYGFLMVTVMLAGVVDARIVLSPRAKTISDNNCMDIDNADPLPLRYGYPSWKTSDDPRCKPVNKVSSDGHCFNSMNPGNNCDAYCQISNGWFYGEPIDAMDGKWCQVGVACSKTYSVSRTSGETIGINSGDKYDEVVVRSNSSSEVDSRALSISIKSDTTVSAGFAVPSIVEVKSTLSLSSSMTDTLTRTRTQSWSRTITETKTFGTTNSTNYGFTIQESDTLTKPSYASGYCGSWFAVPIYGISCGRGAMGKLIQNNKTESAYCALDDQETATFSHCFSYNIADQTEKDKIKFRWSFILRDCRFGYILPGEYQPFEFQNSFAPNVYTVQHIERYGYNNLPRKAAKKPEDDQWNHAGPGNNGTFAKEIGPDDYTIKVCSPGDYCVRHKLTDGNCHNLPRGRAGIQSVQINSVSIKEGKCCTLFSRHECHGHAQNVRGNLTEGNLEDVGFNKQTHSIICNEDLYCNLDLVDTIRGPVLRKA